MTSNPPLSVLGIFAKYWQPGTVKTRLAARIGEASAAHLHYTFLKTTLRRMESLSNAVERQLIFDPPERVQEFRELAGELWKLVPQSKGELGRRLQHFFSTAFEKGARHVVAMGADSPNVPLRFIDQALEALGESDAVIGPSADGGYYLIGLSRALPDVFEAIDWGSERVFQQTIARLEQFQVPFVQLSHWYDVDEFKDLQRLWTDIRELRDVELQELRAAVALHTT